MKKLDPKKILKNVKNQPADREFLAGLRENLVHYMEANPVAKPEVKLVAATSAGRRFAAIPALASILSIALVGGTAFAAQKSLPGDTLYPVKLLTEQIVVAGALTPEAKSKAQIQFAGERVNEAVELAARAENQSSTDDAKYSDAIQTALDNFNAQVGAALDEAQHQKEKNNTSTSDTITENVRAATESYQHVLEHAQEKSNDGVATGLAAFISASHDFHVSAEADTEDNNSHQDSNASTSIITAPNPRGDHGDQRDKQNNNQDSQNDQKSNDNNQNNSSSQDSHDSGKTNENVDNQSQSLEATSSVSSTIIIENNSHSDNNDHQKGDQKDQQQKIEIKIED